MRYFILFFMFLNMPFVQSQSLDLDQVRKNYPLAVSDQSVCKSMISSLENKQEHDLELGYLGAYQAIWANHAWNPIEKLNTFRKGKANIEKAIANKPDEVELRFIRLSIQQNIPRILNYQSNIQSDKKFLLKNFKNIQNKELRKLIANLLENSDLHSTNKNQT